VGRLKSWSGSPDLLDAETKEKLIEEASEAIIPELTKEGRERTGGRKYDTGDRLDERAAYARCEPDGERYYHGV